MLLNTSILKSKLFRVLLHSAAWIVFFCFPLLAYNIKVLDSYFYFKEITNGLFIVALFYLNGYVFIPRFFNRKKIQIYFLVVLLSFVVISIEQISVEYFFFQSERKANFAAIFPLHHRGRFNRNSGAKDLRTTILMRHDSLQLVALHDLQDPFNESDNTVTGVPSFIVFHTLNKAVYTCFIVLLTSGFIKVALEWFTIEKKREELEKEKLNAELIFLKSQINPHFLFNSLNSIYSLIMEPSKKAGFAVLALSNMMRYMIYDSNTEKVSLRNELSYIENYINLQQLRLPEDLHVSFETRGEIMHQQIVPLLLLPLVENTFKHGVSYQERCVIMIKVELSSAGVLDLFTKNKALQIQSDSNTGGFGLDNVKKRLELHYPGKYTLFISEQDGYFNTHLKMQLV